MWAYAPWDNDEAADWFGDFMDATQIRTEWLKGIKADPVDSPEVVRAAAALFIMLGRVYVWPIKSLDEDLELAIASLSKVATTDGYVESSELVAAIEQEVAELKSRRKPAGSPCAPAPGLIKPWWKLW
jgi:hypothetical protein